MKKWILCTLSLLVLCLCVCVCNADNTTAEQQSSFVIYPEFPEEIHRDYTYTVTVTQGDETAELPVYNHTMFSSVSRVTGEPDIYRRFSCFAFSGDPVRVDIKVNMDFKNYAVIPSAKNFKHAFNEGVISVYLDKPDYFMIRINGRDNTILSVFADEPEDLSDIDFDDSDTIVIDGWYETDDGILRLNEPDTTLYIAPGAVLNARVNITADNCRVLGRGAILDPYEDIYNYDIRIGGTEADGSKMTNFDGVIDCVADGVFLLDARCFNIVISKDTSDSIILRNLKILSTMMNTDGISLFAGKNHLVEHCFIYNGDDLIVCCSKDTTIRDIYAGTTCGPLFPQANTRGALFEDCHIFRGEEGAIHHNYKSVEGDITPEVSFNRIDTVDCIYLPNFLDAVNMGSGLKHFVINNVSIGDMKKMRTSTVLRFPNSGYGNWEIELTNFAINGKIAQSLDDIKITGKYVTSLDELNSETSFVSYKTDGDFAPVVHTDTKVKYKAENKVFIGNWQVFFSRPVIVEGDVFYLPAKEIQYELRTEKMADTVEKNGETYIASVVLVASGMAEAAEIEAGSLFITPVNHGQDLFLPESGELSFYAERDTSATDIYTTKDSDGVFYTVYNRKDNPNAGIERLLNEDVQKYGEGFYRIDFQAKAATTGMIKIKLNLGAEGNYDVVTDWQDYSFEFALNKTMALDSMVYFMIQSSGKALSEFSVRNLTLTKIG